MEELGRRATSAGTVYLTGGSSALLWGIRDRTVGLERGHELDLNDARAFVALGLVDTDELGRLARAIRKDLIRYPAIDAREFERKVDRFIQETASDGGRKTWE